MHMKPAKFRFGSVSHAVIATLLSRSLICTRLAIAGDAMDEDDAEKSRKAKNVILIQTDHELGRAEEEGSE